MAELTNGSVESSHGKSSKSFNVSIASRAALIEFSTDHHQNPLNQPRMRELEQLIKDLDADELVGCIVLTGGKGRSFSAGGDFKETSLFKGGDEVDAWIDTFTGLYTTIAGISKPVVAAIDGYAIGIGLQIALCCDYRVGSESCHLVMPELRMGIACNFGGFMLEAVVGRVVMQKMVFTADRWSAETALRDGLLHEVVAPKDVVARGMERAKIIAAWAPDAVRGTRLQTNAAFVNGLKALGEQAKRSHRKAFAAGEAQVRMKEVITKSHQFTPPFILMTTTPIASLEKTFRDTTRCGVHVYAQGDAEFCKAYSWLDEGAEPRQFSEWETGIEVKSNVVRIRTGAMNVPPLYMVRNTITRGWAVGTDPFILNIARSEWGMPLGFANPTVIPSDESTSLLGVLQLPSHSYFEFKYDGTAWRLSTEQLRDPVLDVFKPRVDDFGKAGSLFISSLQNAVSEMTEGETSVATLLSGGIDSGAVTTFAVMSGLKVTAYSAGSPWGNEHDEAKELTDFLGITQVRVDLSEEELLAAVPETIRIAGTAERDRVDILLTVTALIRKGVIKEQHIVTGLGSDLLNLGLPPDSDAEAVMLQNIFDGIDVTRHSGEFTDFIGRGRGKKLSNPYWHKDVVQCALGIHPACKVRQGREKAFFRAAMEPYVPMSTAWRKKIGIHLGGGLQGGLDSTFGGVKNKIAAYEDVLKAITHRVLEDPFCNVDDLAPKPQRIDGVLSSNGALLEGPITPSGAGAVIDVKGLSNSLTELANAILEQTDRSGFVLVKNLDLDEDRFKRLVRAVGEPIAHKYKTGDSDLMKLNGTREKGSVVLGRGMLPFHTDGLILGAYPDLILLYASEFSDKPGSADTTVADQRKALEEMPKALRTALDRVSFEYLVRETGHFPEGLGDKWVAIPPFRQSEGKECLGIAMPFSPGSERSWDVRVAGVSATESDSLLAQLDAFLNQSRYKYEHRWNVGDLLVIDNARTLHGRNALSDDGVRVLFRCQVNRRNRPAA